LYAWRGHLVRAEEADMRGCVIGCPLSLMLWAGVVYLWSFL
jgi:hypothetical protein